MVVTDPVQSYLLYFPFPRFIASIHKAETGKFGRKDEPRLLPDVFLQESIGSGGSGERTRERSRRTLKALEGRMLVQVPSSQLTPMIIMFGQQRTGYC